MITVHLANFQGAEELGAKPMLAEGQGLLEFSLTRQVAGETEVPFRAGSYDFSLSQGKAQQTGSVTIRVAGGKSVSFDKHGTEGTFQVLFVSSSEICGTFSLKDRFSQVSGTFSVPIR